jgi:hypothetical protein
MKYSQLIGIIAALGIIAVCFLPWSYIESRDITVTGMSAPNTNFGKPGLMNIIIMSAGILCFATPRIWTKRLNIFLTLFNLAWSIRNYIVVSGCLMGECPVKKPALYMLIVLSAIVLLMAVLPKIEVKRKEI